MDSVVYKCKPDDTVINAEDRSKEMHVQGINKTKC